MRILAIGDIHGCSTAWDTLMSVVQPQADDLIVTLGDYVDKGPDSKGILDRLLTLYQTGQLVALRGNHEIMMLEARRSPHHFERWRKAGGQQALASYSIYERHPKLNQIPMEHWEFIEKTCVNFWETENHIFVHGNLDSTRSLYQQSPRYLFWVKFADAKPHYSGKTMICGHTPQKNGKPLSKGYAICIDTWVYGEGWLTCLDVNQGNIWQANQKGEYRTLPNIKL